MVIIFRLFIGLGLALNLCFAAGYEDSAWDPYRLAEPSRTLTPIKVTTQKGIELVGYSMGDEARFAKHSKDMWEFFSDDKILATWGGINAKTDTPDQFKESLQRWKERAENNLLSWRLFYHQETLLSTVGSYLPLSTGSSYDGGAEIACNTKSDHWRQGVAYAAVTSYVMADVMRSPFKYLWTTAKPGNVASCEGVLGKGFKPWAVDAKDPLLPSHMNRQGRRFFKMNRVDVTTALKISFEWIEK